ncbi:hypothetical protein AKJ39_05270 [candidate division MSBL1 archaeon SCGC-AAA259J03]|nr:hypothetical protein AKJ39_05270 [candidate division MSBL1 archaeon SCGC-AAA259J03]
MTISLPDDLSEAVDRLTGEETKYRKRSHIFADALKNFIMENYPELLPEENQPGPTVLKGIKSRKGLRGPSPKLKGRKKLEGFRIE